MAGVPESDTVMATPTPSPSSEFESEEPVLQFEKLALATPTPSAPFEFESDSDVEMAEFESEEPELQFETTPQPSPCLESEEPEIDSDVSEKTEIAEFEVRELQFPNERRIMRLSEFFSCLVRATQLLKRSRRVTTFSNVRPYVDDECHPWKFKLHHLAQMKHVLPDEIEIKTVWSSVSKSRTSATEKITKNDKNRRYPLNPDLRIGLEVAHLHISLKCLEKDDSKPTITYEKESTLIKLFTAMLVKVVSCHPKGVPKETLPEPFNRKSKRYTFLDCHL